jgi:polyhydroxybutyrate depolymerase
VLCRFTVAALGVMSLLSGVAVPHAGASTAHGATHTAQPSAGCSKRRPALVPGRSSLLPLDSDGVSGFTYVQVPSTYRSTSPMPVVFDFHGSTETASLQVDVSQLGTLGQTQRFVTVTPEIPNAGLLWDTSLNGAEMRWIGTLFDRIENTLCVNERRVYVTGYSNGAFLASAIACRYAARVAAVAPVAGIETAPGCRPSRPVPVVAFHGTSDPDALFSGGVGPSVTRFLTPAQLRFIGPFLPRSPAHGGLSVTETTAAWARRNGCAPRPDSRQVADDVKLVAYRCRPDAEVELYVVAGGGHTWPGSVVTAGLSSVLGRTTMSIDATEVMWRFFQAHPLTSRS